MHLWTNPELRLQLILHVLLTVILTAVGFVMGAWCGLCLLLAGVLYSALFLISTRRRYKAIAALSHSINRILHGQAQILLSDNREGELAILSSEIQKMTVRLKEQADCLQDDKLRLTDAIADISHQLRTPLTSMNLTVSLLSSENLTPERRLELTHDLKKSLRRIDWLIEALLKMAKIDAGTAQFQSETVPVAELVRRAVAPLSIPMELREQTLRVCVGDESYIGDIAWSAEALGNILKNCTEHTPAGGTIEITATETALFTEITVTDNGPGFDPADIPHLFVRFYRGAGASENSVGIGLALARSVINAQNGTLRAANAPGGGAMFAVRFYKSVI